MPLSITVNRAPVGALVRALSVFAAYQDGSSDCGILDQRTSIDRCIDLASNGWAGPNKWLIKLEITELVAE
jgi:hypothetical protein